jgi:hypothetical protein
MNKVTLTAYITSIAWLNAFGHDQTVHQAITENAADSAAELSTPYSKFLGLVAKENVSAGDARDFLSKGSFAEDFTHTDEGGKRSYNHFYDPLTGLGLSDIPPDIRWDSAIGQDSFTWATTFNCRGVDTSILGLAATRNFSTYNKWSWKNARSYQFIGLVAPGPGDRTIAFTNMFRAIGQVVHLLQDTSQPQHVRNEQHLDKEFLGGKPWLSPIEEYGGTNIGNLRFDHAVLDWRHFGFTKVQDFWNTHNYDGTGPTLDAEAAGMTALGLAEFINGNFIGARHQYAEYYSPGDVQFYPLPSSKR